MVNKKLKKMIAALSVTGAILPFSLNAVPAMAQDVAVQPNPVTGVPQQSSVQKIVQEAGSHISETPLLKVVNQTPKTPVTKKEEDKQEVQQSSESSRNVIETPSQAPQGRPRTDKEIDADFGVKSSTPSQSTQSATQPVSAPQAQANEIENGSDVVEPLTRSAVSGETKQSAQPVNPLREINQYLFQRAVQDSTQNSVLPESETTEEPVNNIESTSNLNPSGLLTSPLQAVNTALAVPAAIGAGVVGALGTGAAALGATLTGLNVLGTTALAVNALPAAALLGAAALPAVGAVVGAGLLAAPAVIGTGLVTTAALGTGAALLAAPVVGATALGAGVLGLGALTLPAATVTAAALAAPIVLGAPLVLGAATLGAQAAALIGAGVTTAVVGTVFTGALFAPLALGAGALALGAVGLLTTATTAVLITGAINAGLLGIGALALGGFTLGALALGAVTLGRIGLGALALGALALGALALPVLGILAIGAMIPLALGGLAALTLPLLLGIGALLAAPFILGTLGTLAILPWILPTLLGLGLLALPALLGIGALFAVPLTIFGLAAAAVLPIALLTMLGLGALAIPALLGLGLLGLLAMGAGALTFGAIVLGALALGALGLGTLFLLSQPWLIALGQLLTRPFAIPLSVLTWTNVGRAWGRFIGSLIAMGIAFPVAGILGWLIGLPGFKALFVAIWECICMPLWAFLGAFNGALVCAPLGAMLGLGLGVLFPLWSTFIGSWLVPLFAALWDSLTGINQFEAVKRSLSAWFSTLNWANVGRAWGRFIGSIIGAIGAVLIIGGLSMTILPPGMKLIGTAFWLYVCIPLWAKIGAFNGALICMPIGTAMGTMIGAAFPLWSLFIGSWLVPMFALLWDSLATANEVLLQVVPRYLARWTWWIGAIEIPSALTSLQNLLVLRYGPLNNRIFKITSFSDSTDSGWGSLGYWLYGKTAVSGLPVLDSTPWLVGYALGAWVDQFSFPGARTNEILFLLDPFYIPDWNLRGQMDLLSMGSNGFWKLLLMRPLARLSVRTSQVVTLSVGSNDLWVPFMSALYDIADDGRLPIDYLTITKRSELFGAPLSMIDNVISYFRAWGTAISTNPTKAVFYVVKLVAGVIKEFTDYFINYPLILLHIFLLNPTATVVIEGMENPVYGWDFMPGTNDDLIETMMSLVYDIYNIYARILTFLYPANWIPFTPGHAVYADMHGIQLKSEKVTIPTYENLTQDGSGFDPHPSWIGRRQRADRVLKALGQPSPYTWTEDTFLRPSIFWNILYPIRPTAWIHPLITRIRPFDRLRIRPIYNFQTILPSFTGALPIQY